MTYTYASSYISGFGKPIEAILKRHIKDVIIVKHFDGLIIYKTKQEFSALRMPWFNNTYQVLAMAATDIKIPYETAVKKFMTKNEPNFAGISDNLNATKNKSFKILPFDSNSPTSIDFNIIKPLETKIKTNLKIKNEFRKHDLDIILSRRREGCFLLLLKLTYTRLTEKNLPNGALRPELCNILAQISDIKPTDIILDPFCGHGSIPKEIQKNLKYNMLFASDQDETLVANLKNEFKKNKKNLFIKQRDALNLSYFQNGFFDEIITDPPWNAYNSKDEDFSIFYGKMLTEFHRILKPNGVCTVLMGNVTDFEKALKSVNFKILEKYHILVNGKKANVYKLVKDV